MRLAVGSVFVTSGMVKFLFVNHGAGRFAKIGFDQSYANGRQKPADARQASCRAWAVEELSAREGPPFG